MMSTAEWQYVSFSEERMVSQLIRGRCQLDGLKHNEDILCVLVGLDR